MSVSTASYISSNIHSHSNKAMMPSMKLKARRSPSSSDRSSTSPSALPGLSNPANESPQPNSVKLLVVDQQQGNKSSSGTTTLRTIRIPPHKDWYSFKPIPRAPLPLYHPLRVSKPRPIIPQSTSTVLPTRSRPTTESNNSSIDVNQVATRSSTRTRRPPTRMRELMALGSGPNSPTTSISEIEKEKDDESQQQVQQEQQQPPAPKPKRHRRTKAEIAAAKAAAAAAAAEKEGEEGSTNVTPRRKRKRADNGNAVGAGDGENEEDASGIVEATPKRRRRGNAANEVTSNYGTRSRSNANAKSNSNSNGNSNKDEETGSPPPTNTGPSTRERSASTIRSASTVEDHQETSNNNSSGSNSTQLGSTEQGCARPETESTVDPNNNNDEMTEDAKTEDRV